MLNLLNSLVMMNIFRIFENRSDLNLYTNVKMKMTTPSFINLFGSFWPLFPLSSSPTMRLRTLQ